MASRVAAGVSLEFAGLSSLQAAVGQGFGVVVGQEMASSAERTTALLNGDPTRYRFTPQEDAFLEELEQACFQFFWDEVNPSTGLEGPQPGGRPGFPERRKHSGDRFWFDGAVHRGPPRMAGTQGDTRAGNDNVAICGIASAAGARLLLPFS